MPDIPLNETPTKNIAERLSLTALISFILVLPLAILEALNQTITKQNATGLILLFGLLWLLPTVFIVILMPVVRAVRAGNTGIANPINFVFRIALLGIIATMWGGILIDQFPCFMGVANCD